MKNLMSNTQFGKFLNTQEISLSCYKQTRQNFDNFISQPLELWMFIPCDENGNVLERPICGDFLSNIDMDSFLIEDKEYQLAKERCLFDGFDSGGANLIISNHETIENISKYNPELTAKAQKQIGL